MRAARNVALGAVLLVAAPAAAQDHARIAGRVVHKATKAGIPGAEIRLAPRNSQLISDSAGHFHFDVVPPGPVRILVRRIGFSPESASFDVAAREDLDVLVEMQETVQQLDTVSVAGRAEPIPRGKLAPYFERKRFGIGSFIDGEVLESERHRQLGDLITSRTAGSRLVRSRIGSAAWVATTRDIGARIGGATLDPIDRTAGADPRACYPDVYIDGMAVYLFGFGRRLFDINTIGTADVSAIEFYVGAARIPPQYNKSSSACGVLLIWTK